MTEYVTFCVYSPADNLGCSLCILLQETQTEHLIATRHADIPQNILYSRYSSKIAKFGIIFSVKLGFITDPHYNPDIETVRYWLFYVSHWFWNFVNLGNYNIKICQGLLLHWRYVRLVSMCQQGWMKNGEKKQESVNSCRRNDRDASTNTWRCHGTNTYLRGKKYFLPSAADKKLPGQSRIVRV